MSCNYNHFFFDADVNQVALFFYGDKQAEADTYVVILDLKGQMNKEYRFPSLEGGYVPGQILSDDYIIGRKLLLNDEGQLDSIQSVFDSAGNEILTDVDTISLGLSGNMDTEIQINIYPYFMKAGVTYDSSLVPVSEGSFDAQGHMIPGVHYDVDGTDCTAVVDYERKSFGTNEEVVAYGKSGNDLLIRTDKGTYTVSCGAGEYVSSNDQAVLINEQDMMKLYDLENGELLADLGDLHCVLAPQYTWTSKYNDVDRCYYYQIIDNGGALRFCSVGEQIQPTNGELFIMSRGPYTGIADLDGNWLMKSLKSEYSADKEIVIPVEN